MHTRMHAHTHTQEDLDQGRKLSPLSTSPGAIFSLEGLLWGGEGSGCGSREGEESAEKGSGFIAHENSSDDDDSGVHSRCVGLG